MKFVIKPRALDDPEWLERHEFEIFPDGAQRTAEQFTRANQAIKNFADSCKPVVGKNSREYVMSDILFSLPCRTKKDRIEVFRIIDPRRSRS